MAINGNFTPLISLNYTQMKIQLLLIKYDLMML